VPREGGLTATKLSTSVEGFFIAFSGRSPQGRGGGLTGMSEENTLWACPSIINARGVFMKVHIRAQAGRASISYRVKEPESREYAKRGDVSVFTDASRRRMLKFLRSSVGSYRAIGTLTYPAEYDASSFRAHWRAFAERWRRLFAGDGGASLFWFLEFQSNGQPHYHFYTNRYIEKGWLSVAWASVVGSGDISHYRAGTNIQSLRSGRSGQVGYALKYAAKNEQKKMPDMYRALGAGRWWGVVGNRDVVCAAIVVDDIEVAVFGLDTLLDLVRRGRGRVLFDDYGSYVVEFDDETWFYAVLQRLKDAEKVLLQAEQDERARFYRARRG
jgi:hypothetical protein